MTVLASSARFALPLVVVASLALATAAPASAHERRQVGEYGFVVGWWDEPAFANQPNGPEVTITKGEEPVNEEVELEVEIGFGGETLRLPLEPAFVVGVFGEEGNYDANLVPTRPGTYTYHITGTVEGREIDETFESGPETFSDIEDPAELAFPAADPNNAELAARLDEDSEQLAAEAASARTLGFVGIGVGALALIVAAIALIRARRRPV